MSRILPTGSETSSVETDTEPRVIDLGEEDADDVFDALSSETARTVFRTVHEEPRPPSEIADAVDTSIQNARYHIDNLQAAGLIEIVDTRYSSRGNEMNVYGPADGPLIVSGTESRTTKLREIVARYLGGVGIVALASLGVQAATDRLRPDAAAGDATGGTGTGPGLADPGDAGTDFVKPETAPNGNPAAGADEVYAARGEDGAAPETGVTGDAAGEAATGGTDALRLVRSGAADGGAVEGGNATGVLAVDDSGRDVLYLLKNDTAGPVTLSTDTVPAADGGTADSVYLVKSPSGPELTVRSVDSGQLARDGVDSGTGPAAGANATAGGTDAPNDPATTGVGDAGRATTGVDANGSVAGASNGSGGSTEAAETAPVADPGTGGDGGAGSLVDPVDPITDVIGSLPPGLVAFVFGIVLVTVATTWVYRDEVAHAVVSR